MAIQIRRRPSRQWDPWSEFRDFERVMNRLFGDTFRMVSEYPPVNVWTGKDDVVLTAELPGMEPDDLDITVHNTMLTLRCSPKEQRGEEGVTFHRLECRHEGFARTVQLPFEVDPDKIEAKLENGVLKLTLPRSEASKPKKVEIQAT